MASDCTFGFAPLVTNEQIVLQSYALFVANAASDDRVASKPVVIMVFAQLLVFNCLSSGLLWMVYLVMPRHWGCCKGVKFRMSIVSVDQISYLLYALFPLATVILDDYNSNRDDISVILGQLTVDRAVPFLATAVPLLFLCHKCLVLTMSTRSKLRTAFYRQWLAVHDIISAPNDEHTVILARSHGIELDEQTLRDVQGEIFDAQGRLQHSILDKIDGDGGDDEIDTVPVGLRKCLSCLSAMYIVFGVLLLVVVTSHFSKSHAYCGSIAESHYVSNGIFMEDISLSEAEELAFFQNPKLLVWDQCIYKVLPWEWPWSTEDEHRCQCRVFVIDWDDDLKSLPSQRSDILGVDAQTLFDGMFTRWTMLDSGDIVGLKATVKVVSVFRFSNIFMLMSGYLKGIKLKVQKSFRS